MGVCFDTIYYLSPLLGGERDSRTGSPPSAGTASTAKPVAGSPRALCTLTSCPRRASPGLAQSAPVTVASWISGSPQTRQALPHLRVGGCYYHLSLEYSAPSYLRASFLQVSAQPSLPGRLPRRLYIKCSLSVAPTLFTPPSSFVFPHCTYDHLTHYVPYFVDCKMHICFPVLIQLKYGMA